MNRQRFAALGIAFLGAGLGVAMTACSPAHSAGAAPAATHAATAPAAAPSSSPARSVPPAAPAAVTHAPATHPPATHAPAAAASASAPAGTATFALWDCAGNARVRPSAYVLACADHGMGLTGMHWASWRPGHATGTGIEYENDCQPDCADGKIIDYPVHVTLTGSVLWSQSGPFSYARVTLHYPDAAPAVYSTVNGKITVTHPATFSIPLTGRPAHPAGD